MGKTYTELAEYLTNSEIYKEDFVAAEEAGLFDYMGILIWKTFILFSYEKIQQVRLLVGDIAFEEKYWIPDTKKGDKAKLSLAKFDASNTYAYSSLPNDDMIVETMITIFQLEKNFKCELDLIKKKRDYAAHVVRPDLFALKRSEINSMLEKLIHICGHIDENYKKHFIANAPLKAMEQLGFSSSEINFYLNQKINSLKDATSFDVTRGLVRELNRNISKLSHASIEAILESIQEGVVKYGHHQVLDSGRDIDEFLKRLLSRSIELGTNLESWQRFYAKMGEKQQENLLDIKHSLEKNGIKFNPSDIKFIDPEDIPF